MPDCILTTLKCAIHSTAVTSDTRKLFAVSNSDNGPTITMNVYVCVCGCVDHASAERCDCAPSVVPGPLVSDSTASAAIAHALRVRASQGLGKGLPARQDPRHTPPELHHI